MLIACPQAFIRRHGSETAGRVNYRHARIALDPKVGRWKFQSLNRRDGLVDSCALFLTDAHAPHERRERLVPGTRRRVDEAVYGNKRFTGVCDFNSVREELNQRTRSRDRQVLVDQGVGNQLSNCDVREHFDLFPEGAADLLAVPHQQRNCVENALKSRCVPAHLVNALDDLRGAVLVIMRIEPNGLAGKTGVDFSKVLGEESGPPSAAPPQPSFWLSSCSSITT